MQGLLPPAEPQDVRLARAAAGKARGNALYAAREYDLAVNEYLAAAHELRRIFHPVGLVPPRPPTAAEAAARALMRDCDSNAAAAWLQFREPAPALACAEAALDTDGAFAKAQERRATALEMLGMPRAAALVRGDTSAAAEASSSAGARPARCVTLRCVGDVPPPHWEHRAAVLRGRLYVLCGMLLSPENSMADGAAALARAHARGEHPPVHSAAVADMLSPAGVVTWRRERTAGASAPPVALASFVLAADEARSALLLHAGAAAGCGAPSEALRSDTWALRLGEDGAAMRWERLRTRGEAPPASEGAAGALVGRTLLVHGGEREALPSCGSSSSGELFALDVDALTWRRLTPRGAAAAPSPRAFHTLTLLSGDDGDARLLLFGQRTYFCTDSLRCADVGRSAYHCDTHELRLRPGGGCEWRVPRMRGSPPLALPRGGPKAGRAQHAAWAMRDGGDAASLCIYGGFAPGTPYFGDLRSYGVEAGTWSRYDWAGNGGEGDTAIVPRARCGHSATPLDATGAVVAVVAVWGGASTVPRHELLLLTLTLPAPPAPAPAPAPAEAAAPPMEPMTDAEAAFMEMLVDLVKLENEVLSGMGGAAGGRGGGGARLAGARARRG